MIHWLIRLKKSRMTRRFMACLKFKKKWMKLEGNCDHPARNDGILDQTGVGGKGAQWTHSLHLSTLWGCSCFV